MIVVLFCVIAQLRPSCALWAGFPLLTRIGESFAARVAASLLNAANLSELTKSSVDEYEKLATKLGTHPDEIKVIRRVIYNNSLSSNFFDTFHCIQ